MEDMTDRSINTGSQQLPGVRCGKMVSPAGMAASYPCWVELDASGDHEGPCAIIESGKSMTDRRAWLEARAAEQQRSRDTVMADHQPVPSRLPPGIPVPPTVLSASELTRPEQRHDEDMQRFLEGRLSWVNQAFMAHQCMVALGLLYSRVQREYARGVGQVVITPEYLQSLVPATAKTMFDQFAVAPQEAHQ